MISFASMSLVLNAFVCALLDVAAGVCGALFLHFSAPPTLGTGLLIFSVEELPQ